MNHRIFKTGLVVCILTGMLTACSRNGSPFYADDPIPVDLDTSAVRSGNFINNAHRTTGTVKVTEAINKRLLVFQNFRTDNGPDLRVRLSRNTGVADYREVGPLRAVSGNFFYEIADSVDLSQYKYVLIWCEDFSVLFGHAILQ